MRLDCWSSRFFFLFPNLCSLLKVKMMSLLLILEKTKSQLKICTYKCNDNKIQNMRLTFLLVAGCSRCFFTFAIFTISYIFTIGWLVYIANIFLMKLFDTPGIFQIMTIVSFLTKTYSTRVDKISTRTIRLPYKYIESKIEKILISGRISKKKVK